MKKFVAFNLNDRIRFKPTEKGLQHWARFHKELRIPAPALVIDKEGFVEMQGHEFCMLFGGGFIQGPCMPEVFVEIEQ